MSQMPGTAPGWYPVDASGDLWWWDGYQWTGYRHPGAVATYSPDLAAPPAPTENIPTRTVASWLIALLPIVGGLLGGVLLLSSTSARLGVVALGLVGLVLLPASIGLSFWDMATLRSRGSTIASAHALWILLGGWVYLLVRATLLKGSDRERWMLIAVNLVAVLATTAVLFVGLFSVFTGEEFRRDVFYQQASVEQTIERGVSNRAGFDVKVDCPDNPPIAQGDSFQCRISDASGQVLGVATVTWTDNFGTFEWEAHPGTDAVNPQT